MAIKQKVEKLTLRFPLEEFVQTALQKHVLTYLPIALPHMFFTENLPFHHRDPFDRIVIAQALVEKIPAVSSDDA